MKPWFVFKQIHRIFDGNFEKKAGGIINLWFAERIHSEFYMDGDLDKFFLFLLYGGFFERISEEISKGIFATNSEAIYERFQTGVKFSQKFIGVHL